MTNGVVFLKENSVIAQMIKMGQPLPWTRSALHAAHGSEAPSVLHKLGFPASKGMSDYLYYSLLTALVLINNILNDTLWSPSAFLTMVIMDQHPPVQKRYT